MQVDVSTLHFATLLPPHVWNKSVSILGILNIEMIYDMRMQAYQTSWLEPDSELAQRMAVLGRLVSELGCTFVRLAVFEAEHPGTVSTVSNLHSELAQAALHFCMLRHGDLAKCGIDFWYSVSNPVCCFLFWVSLHVPCALD